MIVLDSNILVAALLSRRGASFWLLERAIAGRLDVAISVALALEYEAVLKRRELAQASWLNENDLDHILDALLAAANLVQPIHFRQRPALADPGDDLVLECAVEGAADVIVTMNQKDFKGIGKMYGIQVKAPGDIVREIRERES